ncbi:acyl dehydratase [Moraxella bovoculi]|uniref:Acyl dehydratase n=1 Tax=Moraxella ovis TaxID=29433 RepID=A0A160GEE9_9GAMM|nr:MULTISPECIES: MaoC/PaaZ C-terminal domain-containing protein [Moraxella]AKG16831.1 acyl dehydratase [Moraxella bovoculi]AKG18569.1 acyl dehydratase [Moraxella bovoculi]ANB91257.1 acyl dehydratase [Moraxella ovis]NSM09881.1 acyl dehydratase [Moraxella bovoculi]SPX85005.1 Enoyl reductase domain of yeast-type FAS1 [Moraxella ovis]
MAEQHFKELPKMHTTYANVIKSLIPIGDNKATTLPESVYQVDSLAIDEHNLKEYRKICGFINDGRVPPTYFAVLSQTLQMNMMAKPDFPFAMLGLVHIENSVTQHRIIYDSETVALTVRLDNLKAHDKGQQFDFITTVTIDDELVWEGVSTYLSRQKKTAEERARAKSIEEPQPRLEADENHWAELINIPEDIGRRYAFVSGDFNLIHLHPLSARAFGFPRAIAHGMWSKAASIAQFHDLPKAYRVDVSFKTPIFLPSKIDFVARAETDGRQFALYAAGTDKPHLLGRITFL